MLEILFRSFNRDNSITVDGRTFFHEDLMYNAFACHSLAELREHEKDLIVEGIIEYVELNFYATSLQAEHYRISHKSPLKAA
ncbi:MAG: hypothetical protein ABIJ34_06385 [archaeon]